MGRRHISLPARAGTQRLAARRPWYDGAVDQLLVTFAVLAVALVIGLVASGADVDLLDLGADAMLVAAGITGTERLVARHRAAAGGRAAPTAVLLCVAAAVGAVGGLANLGA